MSDELDRTFNWEKLREESSDNIASTLQRTADRLEKYREEFEGYLAAHAIQEREHRDLINDCEVRYVELENETQERELQLKARVTGPLESATPGDLFGRVFSGESRYARTP